MVTFEVATVMSSAQDVSTAEGNVDDMVVASMLVLFITPLSFVVLTVFKGRHISVFKCGPIENPLTDQKTNHLYVRNGRCWPVHSWVLVGDSLPGSVSG